MTRHRSIERWHKTLRGEFLNNKVFADITDAQARLDDWVAFYNRDRPHQSLGMAAPWERFRLADTRSDDDHTPSAAAKRRLKRHRWCRRRRGRCPLTG